MVSQYPAEQPGNNSSTLNTQDSMPDSRTDLLPTVPAPVAAVTNLDALTLDTQPGAPDVQHLSSAINKKGKKEKKVKEKGVSYFSLYRSEGLYLYYALQPSYAIQALHRQSLRAPCELACAGMQTHSTSC